jgi:tRNA (mo5U34)-methyltransferase
MDRKSRQAEVDGITWYHEFDFGGGLRTRTHPMHLEAHRRFWAFVESQLAAVDFRDKSVLDVGAWDGYWSFYAEKRGARAVLASDDLSQNWSQGRGIHLAKELLDSRIEIDQRLSVYDLATLGRTFDVILFLGVYYHLHDPFHALAQIRHCCRPGTVVVLQGPLLACEEPISLYNFADHQCEWAPSVGGLSQLLKAAYFTQPSVACIPKPPAPPRTQPPRLGWRWRLKTCLAALRGSRSDVAARLAEVLPPKTVSADHHQSAVLICRAYEGEVDLHYYRPPFGLHAYDPRFRDAPSRRSA